MYTKTALRQKSYCTTQHVTSASLCCSWTGMFVCRFKRKCFAIANQFMFHFSSLSCGTSIKQHFVIPFWIFLDSGSSLDPIFRDFLPGKLQENKELVKIVKAVYQWNITKDGKTAAVWSKFSSFVLDVNFK